jgi:hypothetical protein
MKNKLALKSVRAKLAEVDITIRKTVYGEYLVRIKGSPKGEGYYTTDLEDAYNTGELMALRIANV